MDFPPLPPITGPGLFWDGTLPSGAQGGGEHAPGELPQPVRPVPPTSPPAVDDAVQPDDALTLESSDAFTLSLSEHAREALLPAGKDPVMTLPAVPPDLPPAASPDTAPPLAPPESPEVPKPIEVALPQTAAPDAALPETPAPPLHAMPQTASSPVAAPPPLPQTVPVVTTSPPIIPAEVPSSPTVPITTPPPPAAPAETQQAAPPDAQAPVQPPVDPQPPPVPTHPLPPSAPPLARTAVPFPPHQAPEPTAQTPLPLTGRSTAAAPVTASTLTEALADRPPLFARILQPPFPLYLFGNVTVTTLLREAEENPPPPRPRPYDDEGGSPLDERAPVRTAEAVKLACILHDLRRGGSAAFPAHVTPWYVPYVHYAVQNKLMKPDFFTDFAAPITRGELARLLSSALPAVSLRAARDTLCERFAPEDTLPRMEAAILISRLARL